jgi:LysR family hca operon transcriptional activator
MERIVELRHLKYFIAVVESGGMTAASERLHTSQPSLGRQLKDLESHIGAALFHRDRRPFSLTPAGEVLLTEARLVLALVDRAVDRTREAARQKARRLLVGFDYGLEAGNTARLLQVLQGSHPGMDLVMRSQPSPQLIADVRDGTLDAGFVLMSDDASDLACHILQRDSMIAAVSIHHRLAKRRAISLNDLADEPLIVANAKLAPVLHEATLEAGLRNGVVLQIAYEPESMMVAFSLISSVNGICLLPDYASKAFPKDVVYVKLKGDIPKVALALISRADNPSVALQAVLAGFHTNSNEGFDDSMS